jgi:hypothetical protein
MRERLRTGSSANDGIEHVGHDKNMLAVGNDALRGARPTVKMVSAGSSVSLGHEPTPSVFSFHFSG